MCNPVICYSTIQFSFYKKNFQFFIFTHFPINRLSEQLINRKWINGLMVKSTCRIFLFNLENIRNGLFPSQIGLIHRNVYDFLIAEAYYKPIPSSLT